MNKGCTMCVSPHIDIGRKYKVHIINKTKK